MAEDWFECKVEDMMVGDVVRWQQPIWPKRKRKKAVKHGDRRTTAQILEIDGHGDLRLSVLRDEIVKNEFGMPLDLLKKGEEITRKRVTIAKGKPQRMKWSDESARPKVGSEVPS